MARKQISLATHALDLKERGWSKKISVFVAFVMLSSWIIFAILQNALVNLPDLTPRRQKNAVDILLHYLESYGVLYFLYSFVCIANNKTISHRKQQLQEMIFVTWGKTDIYIFGNEIWKMYKSFEGLVCFK